MSKWNNITSVRKDIARYDTLYPDTGNYSRNEYNEVLIEASQDFTVYYQSLSANYSLAIERIGTDGSGVIDFYISADGVNFSTLKATDGVTDFSISYDTADTDNVIMNRVDRGYIKIVHTNTDNTEGNIIIKLKTD